MNGERLYRLHHQPLMGQCMRRAGTEFRNLRRYQLFRGR
jgi:hypothetical protein